MKLKIAETQFEFFSLMLIRSQVFMCEQNVDPAIELDEEDKTAIHFILMDDTNKIVGTCRTLYQNDSWHLGRIAISKEVRHKHYGTYMLKEVETLAKEKKIKRLELGAQLQAKGFYEANGFSAYGDEFIEAAIMHVMMEKIL